MNKLHITFYIFFVLYHKSQAFPENREETMVAFPENSEEPGIESIRVQERRLPQINNRIRMPANDGIIFPDDNVTEALNYIPKSAPRCRHSTFCEEVQDYPKDFVKTAIRINTELKYLSFVDQPVDIGVDQRLGNRAREDVLCLFNETIIRPKSAENKNKEWRYVVNDETFPQHVRIETCINENNTCRLVEGFAEGYTTSCRQKYIYRQLAAISNDGSITPDYFRFPSSCCCHVYFEGEPMQRIGVTGGRSRDAKVSNTKRNN